MSDNMFRVIVEVEVKDRQQLAAFAKKRALEGGMTAQEFDVYQDVAYQNDDEIGFWLGWAFDNGTPPDSGFAIEQTTVESNGI